MEKVREHFSKLSTVIRSHIDTSKRSGTEMKKGFVPVKGNLTKSIVSKTYHKATICIESFLEDENTNYQLVCNGSTVVIASTMSLAPVMEKIDRHATEFIITISDVNNHFIDFTFTQYESFMEWYSILRVALTETIFNDAYKTKFGGSVSMRSVEAAIKQCSLYLPQQHPFMLRAKRIWNVKVEVHESLAKLTVNPLAYGQEDLWSMVFRAEREQV